MAKYPRSNRKKYQIQKAHAKSNWGNWYVQTYNLGSRIPLRWFKTKKQAREYIARKRRSIKNRGW